MLACLHACMLIRQNPHGPAWQVIALDLELLAELSSFDAEDSAERQQLANTFFTQCGLHGCLPIRVLIRMLACMQVSQGPDAAVQY